MKKRIFAILLCMTLLFSTTIAHATNNESYKENPSITMDEINSSATELVYMSDETLFWPDPANLLNRSFGTYPISTRVTIQSSSSNGILEQDSQVGNYASIASLGLSFSGIAPLMTVSTILSVVGLVASQNTYVEAKTFISYQQFRKQAEARWADESVYTACAVSGLRNYYKHVLGATENAQGKWTTKSRDYLDTPCKVIKGSFYNNTDTWFKQQASERLQSGSMLLDIPW